MRNATVHYFALRLIAGSRRFSRPKSAIARVRPGEVIEIYPD
jgi:hypothetical protein